MVDIFLLSFSMHMYLFAWSFLGSGMEMLLVIIKGIGIVNSVFQSTFCLERVWHVFQNVQLCVICDNNYQDISQQSFFCCDDGFSILAAWFVYLIFSFAENKYPVLVFFFPFFFHSPLRGR